MSKLEKEGVKQTKAQKSLIDIKLGESIRRLRILRGYSQDAVARKIGVTFQQLQKYECGLNRVCVSRLFDISKSFSVPPSYLVNLVNDDVQSQCVSEEGAEFLYKNGVKSVEIDDKEMLALIRAYKTISKPEVRKKAISLIRCLGEESD